MNEPSDQGGIWILDTSWGGSDLRASSHRVTSDARPGLEATSELTLNANSTRVHAVVTRRGQNPYLTKRVIDLGTGQTSRLPTAVNRDNPNGLVW